MVVELEDLDDDLAADAAVVNRDRVDAAVRVDELEPERWLVLAIPAPQYGRIAALPRSRPVGAKPRSTISGERIPKSSWYSANTVVNGAHDYDPS